MDRGSITHDVIEQSVSRIAADGCLDRVCVRVPASVLAKNGAKSTNAYRDWLAEQPAGVWPLKDGEHNPFAIIMDHLYGCEKLAGPLASETKEHVVLWGHAATGTACRVRIDSLWNDRIYDWKTTRDIMPRGFQAEVQRRRYYVRLAFYQMALEVDTGKRMPVVAVAIKNAPGYGVQPYELHHEWLAKGREIVNRTLAAMQTWRPEHEAAANILLLREPRYAAYDSEYEWD